MGLRKVGVSMGRRQGDFWSVVVSPLRARAPRELRRREFSQRAVWRHLVVVVAPRFESLLCVGEVEEHVDVEAFVTKLAVEALGKAIFHLPGQSDDVELHSVAI